MIHGREKSDPASTSIHSIDPMGRIVVEKCHRPRIANRMRGGRASGTWQNHPWSVHLSPNGSYLRVSSRVIR